MRDIMYYYPHKFQWYVRQEIIAINHYLQWTSWQLSVQFPPSFFSINNWISQNSECPTNQTKVWNHWFSKISDNQSYAIEFNIKKRILDVTLKEWQTNL